MAEPADQVHARAEAAAGPGGHLPLPPQSAWDNFPWTVADGAVVPRRLPLPSDEPARSGESDDRPCPTCTDGLDPARVVWEDELWVLTHGGEPTGLPLVLVLHSREHLDMGTLDDELASQLGRITNRLVRITEGLPEIARTHVLRYGDGGSHLHVWFVSRTARLTGVIGSPTIEWADILPPGPEDVWRADLRTVATKLANWGGDARA